MIFKYAIGQQLAVLLKGAQEFLARAILLPEQLAIWNLAVVIATTFALAKANLVAVIPATLIGVSGVLFVYTGFEYGFG